MAEEWRVVGVDPRYEVSSMGRIRRIGGQPRTISIDARGYSYIKVRVSGSGRRLTIHRVVAAAFLGVRVGLDVNHLDGVKTNNVVTNLEWATRRENVRHAVRTGLHPSGTRHGTHTKPESRNRGEARPQSKLTEATVKQIRERAAVGQSHRRIAKAFGVAKNTIDSAVSRTTWKHVD